MSTFFVLHKYNLHLFMYIYRISTFFTAGGGGGCILHTSTLSPFYFTVNKKISNSHSQHSTCWSSPLEAAAWESCLAWMSEPETEPSLHLSDQPGECRGNCQLVAEVEWHQNRTLDPLWPEPQLPQTDPLLRSHQKQWTATRRIQRDQEQGLHLLTLLDRKWRKRKMALLKLPDRKRRKRKMQVPAQRCSRFQTFVQKYSQPLPFVQSHSQGQGFCQTTLLGPCWCCSHWMTVQIFPQC